MLSEKSLSIGKTRLGIAIVLCLALAAVPLVACSGQSASDSGSSSAPEGQAAAFDPGWETYGDAMDAQTAAMSAGWNDDYYVSVFKVDESIVRVVAKMTPEVDKVLDELDWSTDNVSEQIDEAVRPLKLESVEDLTGGLLSPEDLASYEGKTGKDLVDEGWTFQTYFMYGGEQTGATFVKGYLAYTFTFNVTVTEAEYEDGGASVMDVPVVEVEFEGASEAATDPTKVK